MSSAPVQRDSATLHILGQRTGASAMECSDALERFEGDAALAEGYLAYVHASSVALPQQGSGEAEAKLDSARRQVVRYGGEER